MSTKTQNKKTVRTHVGARVPVFRFSGFSGAWEEKKLGEIFENTRGHVLAMPKVAKEKTKEYQYPVYSSQTKNDGLSGYYKDYLFKDCITWTTDGANAGDVKFRKGKFYCTNVCGVLKSDKGYANICIAEIFNKISKKYVSYVGNPKLMNNVVSHIKIVIPNSINEQQKIAAFLESVDNFIENLRAQKESFESYKKGMMQKIFSQEIRFKDNNGKSFPEWEEKKLGDIGKISTSSVDKKTNEDEKKVSLLNYMDVYRRDHIFQNDNFQIVSAKDSQIFSSNLKQGDILFTPSSETPDDIGHSAVAMEDLKDVLFSYHLVRFRPKKNILDFNFSAYAFKSFKFYKNLWRKAQGATRFTLSKDAFESSKIEIPKSLDEQKKIADFLISIDKLIDSKQQKIENAEQWKKGLMQQMFV